MRNNFTNGNNPMTAARLFSKLNFQSALKDLSNNTDLSSLSGKTKSILFNYIKIHRNDVDALNLREGKVDTLLITLIESKYMELLDYLLLDGTKGIVNTPGLDGKTPLALACFRGSYHIVKRLLDHPEININDVGNNSSWPRTPLYYAAIRGHIEIVDLLLSPGNNRKNADKTIDGHHALTCIENDIPELRSVWCGTRIELEEMKDELRTETDNIIKSEKIDQKELERYELEVQIWNLQSIFHMLKTGCDLVEAKEQALETLKEKWGIQIKNPEVLTIPFAFLARQMSGQGRVASVALGSRVISDEQKTVLQQRTQLTAETNFKIQPLTPISTRDSSVAKQLTRPHGLPEYGTLTPFDIRPMSQNYPSWELPPCTEDKSDPILSSTPTTPCGTPRSNVTFHIPPAPLSPLSHSASTDSFLTCSPILPLSPQSSSFSSLVPLSPRLSFSSCSSPVPLSPQTSFSSCNSNPAVPFSPLPPSHEWNCDSPVAKNRSAIFGLSPVKEGVEQVSPVKPPRIKYKASKMTSSDA